MGYAACDEIEAMKLFAAPGEAAKIPSDLSICHYSSIDIAFVSYQAMQWVSLAQAAHQGAWQLACQAMVVHCRSPQHTCTNQKCDVLCIAFTRHPCLIGNFPVLPAQAAFHMCQCKQRQSSCRKFVRSQTSLCE